MPDIPRIPNILEALNSRSYPTVTLWNRLEGRPRREDFSRALKAEIRDPLWMLTRQWQMGEFKGDDAGSPFFAKLHLATTRLTKYKAGDDAVQPFEEATPLEGTVERRPIPKVSGGNIPLDIRLLMGRQWLKLVRRTGDYARAYIDRYPIETPDPTRKEDAYLCAHAEVWQAFAAAAGRLMDGAALYRYLKDDPGHRAYDDIPVLDSDKPGLDAAAAKFITWYENLFFQPQDPGAGAWEADRLEYRFACSAPADAGEKVLVADEYYHGDLDWYNFNIDRGTDSLGSLAGSPDPRGTDTQTLIPVPLAFEGMPDTRWWAFEDRQTNFGDVQPDTTDLAKLMLIEFGLVYANDWFLIPHTLHAGTIADIIGLMVTNVFGERFWIEPAGRGEGEAWQRWSMFTLTAGNSTAAHADAGLLVLPTVPKIQESSPAEEIVLIRDEMANMVWGVERYVPTASGAHRPGAEAAADVLKFHQRLLNTRLGSGPGPSAGSDYAADLYYQLMNSVPEHWIPFIPVHVDGDNRKIQLQRAAMPRILPGDTDPPEKVRPRTTLLREGLDESPRRAYFIHEEEVPRAGVRVRQSYQRTRWRDGKVFVWLGIRKLVGRGEGSSGLAFDRALPAQRGPGD